MSLVSQECRLRQESRADEVGAIVLDVGHYSLRAGYAGEDTPKAEIPSHVAVVSDPLLTENGHMDVDGVPPADSRKYFIDTTSLNVPRKNAETVTFLKDGMIEDWDLFEKMLDYVYFKHIKSESSFHPVLMSEASVSRELSCIPRSPDPRLSSHSGMCVRSERR